MDHSPKYRRTLLGIAAVVSVLVIFTGCGKNGGREVQGNVISIRGTVTIDSGKESGSHPQSATVASKLSVGDRLETSPDAMAALLLIPGILVQMGGGTEIVIGELRVEKQGDAMVDAMKSRRAALHLNRGVIFASLPSVGSGSCKLNVQTGIGTLVAQRGALVSMRLAKEAVRIVCVDGEVQWNSARGGPVDKIPEAYFRDYRMNGFRSANSKPQLTSVSENAEAQSDVAASLETAAAFDEFVLRVRNAPAPKSSHPIERPAVQPH
jgi:hypothetical protein